MTTPIADNPAVTNPRRVLTPAACDALVSIDFFRHQARQGANWRVGNKRFTLATISSLQKHRLLREQNNRLQLTMAGQVAIERLKGKGI
jgi:hypothetical protein